MKKLALFALLACAGASFAQPVPAGWIQPWTPDLPSFESRVRSCEVPRPFNRIAADDFAFSVDYTFTQINWWGTLTPQIGPIVTRYYIAIYKESGNCTPAWSSLVYRACVSPQVQTVGVDCKNQRVLKFTSNHLPVTLPAGRYWLQVSEDDQASSQPGVIDFQWSAHAPIVNCPALQMDALGVVIQPLIESCFQRRVDLAFEIL